MAGKGTIIGLNIPGNVPWGTHVCQFYGTKQDLIDILIPYFRAGLENNEFCMWITSEPLSEKEAKEALKEALPNLDKYLKKGQIEIIPHHEWYLKNGTFNSKKVLASWMGKLNQALSNGYDGMRVTGNTTWLKKKDWKDFTQYEKEVNKVIGNHKMIAICSYSLDKCSASQLIDVISSHRYALIKEGSKWKVVGSSERPRAEEERELVLDELNERIKELNCLYNLSKIIERPGISLDEVFGEAVHLTPSSWQYPDITCCRVVCAGKELRTKNFKVTKWNQSADINISGKKEGIIEVYYLKEKPKRDEGPFLKEERDLIDALADRLGVFVKHRRAEDTIQESEEKYRNLVELAPDAILTVDLRGRVTACNQAFIKTSGYSIDEIVGKHFARLPTMNARDIPRYIKIFGAILKGEAIKPFEASWKYKDGSLRIVEVHIGLLKSGNKTIGVQSIIRDITERKGAEKAQRESEEKYKGLARDIPGMAYKGRADWTTSVIFNSEVISGYTPDEFNSDKANWLDIIHSEDKPQVMEETSKLAECQAEIVQEYRIVTKEGETRWIADHKSSRFTKDGDFDGVDGVVFDITERKKAKEELEKTNRELMSTNKQLKQTQAQLIQAAKMAAMGELGAGIAHELNQPLGGIKGFTELILEELDEKGQFREDLLQIKRQADRMAKIVRNISTFARQATFEYSPLDMNTPLEQALMLISQQFREHKIELVKDLDPNLPKVKADANQLQQVFLNIASNAKDALDATGRENKKLTIITKPSFSFVEITFTDNGCGIGEEDLNKIFDPFFTTKAVGRGTGLGLSVTYGIIKDHFGLIDISSAKNGGTVARILLPTIESKPCWEIKKCSKDTRDRCPAFKENKGYLCWTIGGTCCKQKVKETGKSWEHTCKECEVYQKYRIPPAPKPPKVRTFK